MIIIHIKKVQDSDFIDLQGIFTHLAAAEELDKAKELGIPVISEEELYNMIDKGEE